MYGILAAFGLGFDITNCAGVLVNVHVAANQVRNREKEGKAGSVGFMWDDFVKSGYNNFVTRAFGTLDLLYTRHKGGVTFDY